MPDRAVSKVILNGTTLMDVTQDSVTASTLASGETATGADGVRLTGSAVVPQPSSATPSMDGTAAVGTSTDYARGDHVHPTDTGRAASTHYHGAITSVGAITSDTAVASGDKLVIVDANDANKIKRSGIAFGSSTTTFLRNDGTWQAPSGGGGGGGSSWTNVTADFEAAQSDVEISQLLALKSDEFVYVAGEVSGNSDALLLAPSGCEPAMIAVGSSIDVMAFTPSICYADDASMGVYFGESASTPYYFTIAYPI